MVIEATAAAFAYFLLCFVLLYIRLTTSFSEVIDTYCNAKRSLFTSSLKLQSFWVRDVY